MAGVDDESDDLPTLPGEQNLNQLIDTIVADVSETLKSSISGSQRTHNLRNKQSEPQQNQSGEMSIAQMSVIIGAIMKNIMPVIVSTIKETIKTSYGNGTNAVQKSNNDEILKLKLELDDSNQYHRRDGVRINGISQEENESNDQLVGKIVTLAQKIDCDLTEADVSVAHRLNIKVRGVNQIICKFTSRRAKEMFYRARKKLKDKPECEYTYISEDLTKLRYKLLQATKKCTRFKAVTTVRGNIWVYRIGEDNPIKIVRPSDLEQLGLVPDYKDLGLA